MVTIPLWMIWVGVGFVVLSCISNALSMSDRSFYGFIFRFMRLLTWSAGKELEQLHIPVPQIPTQADVSDPSAATK